MAGVTGYYVGNYFLGWEFISSMILALIFIFITIFVETSLFILRQISISKKKARATSDKKKVDINWRVPVDVGKKGKNKKDWWFICSLLYNYLFLRVY